MRDKSCWSVEKYKKMTSTTKLGPAPLFLKVGMCDQLPLEQGGGDQNENVGLRTGPCHLYKHFRWTQLSLLLLDTR